MPRVFKIFLLAEIKSAIFLLDQKVEALEFMDRIKAIALRFNKLSDNQKKILKHWIRNTKEETIANEAMSESPNFIFGSSNLLSERM